MRQLEPPKTIDLPPTEYQADIPNKREPILGEDAAVWITYFASMFIVAAILGYVRHP